MAEDRELFKEAMKIGVPVCPSGIANNFKEAKAIANEIGSYPLIIRPAFTLGGTGGGIAYNQEEFEEMAQFGIDASPSVSNFSRKISLGLERIRIRSHARLGG
jgi:carbamoyl-phosphate synthase large subunit